MKKLLLATGCGAIAAALAAFVAGGYFKGRRAEHRAAVQRNAVHALTQQQLAAAVAQCDSPPEPGQPQANGARADAKYCEDVAREMDERPLEIVKPKPPEPAVLPHR